MDWNSHSEKYVKTRMLQMEGQQKQQLQKEELEEEEEDMLRAKF